jgi:fibrillarin-like pre-rRNA processing protein
MEPLNGTDGTVFTERGHLYTRSRNPGVRVYGERLLTENGIEYREWPPDRSKLSAYLKVGGRAFPFRRDSKVLYLGAASGTTSSHVSDIAYDGKVYCIEFSPRSFRDLVGTATGRENMMPILADATRPDEYGFLVDNVDIVYADVAQKRQADILADNMERYCARYGVLCVKARSEDVTARPEEVFAATEKRLKERGCRILDNRGIEPYEKSHTVIVVEKPRTAYVVAMKDGKFLMVHNLRRKGWEMPGGKVEKGETSEEGAQRECLEESGYKTEVMARKNIGYCDVCACRLGEKVAEGEMESKLFEELPDELSFDTDEYDDVISWAKQVLAGSNPPSM